MDTMLSSWLRPSFNENRRTSRLKGESLGFSGLAVGLSDMAVQELANFYERKIWGCRNDLSG
jgi:hypothetical protein